MRGRYSILTSAGVAVALIATIAYLPHGVNAFQKPTGTAALIAGTSLWPPPTGTVTQGTTLVQLAPAASFSFVGPACASQAWDLYKPIIFAGQTQTNSDGAAASESAGDAPPVLDTLKAELTTCVVQAPAPDTSESYTLTVDVASSSAKASATITAETYVGLLRALETLSQLAVAGTPDDDAARARPGAATTVATAAVGVYIPTAPVSIADDPTFSHRGVLLDTSRHFIPVATLQRTIDACMFSKLNVLHLHLTDSHSFPVDIPARPNVTLNGAFSADEVYSTADLQALVTYAAQRGVRLLPEIDTPGHSRAFGLSPELAGIVACANVPQSAWSTYCAEPPCGQLNPASSLMYDVLGDVLAHVGSVFPDAYMHLGFDEVNNACYTSDATIEAYLKAHNLTVNGLVAEFFTKERALLRSTPHTTPVYWEEAVKLGLPLQEGDVIQFWSDKTLIPKAFAVPGVSAVVSWSASYYEDCGTGNVFGDNSWCDPFKTWWTMYNTDPVDGLTASEVARVLGGESALWSELNDAASTDKKMWPRSAAFAGRLWSHELPTLGLRDAVVRMNHHVERLQARGIDATPVVDEYCATFPDACFAASNA